MSYKVLSNILMGGHDLEDERDILSKMLKNYNTLYGGNNEELQTSNEIREEGINAMNKLMEHLKDNPELLEELNKLREENKEFKKKRTNQSPGQVIRKIRYNEF
jgi:predicted nuclease with TOPRIM domain